MKTNDCPECGRPLASSFDEWTKDVARIDQLCGVAVASAAQDACAHATIARLKSRVADLEQQLSPRLRVWELHSGPEIWCVATDAEECWGYLEDQHGNPDEIKELKAEGIGWVALPDDKKILIAVDSDGDICNVDDGTPMLLPCWVWAARRGPGFLAETE